MLVDARLVRHFIAAAEHLHFAHAAKSAEVSRTELVASVKQLEAELGYPLFDYDAPSTTLTPEGEKFFATAKAERLAPPYSRVAPGGKAKASKGKGRTPAVKGAPRVGKRRQSR